MKYGSCTLKTTQVIVSEQSVDRHTNPIPIGHPSSDGTLMKMEHPRLFSIPNTPWPWHLDPIKVQKGTSHIFRLLPCNCYTSSTKLILSFFLDRSVNKDGRHCPLTPCLHPPNHWTDFHNTWQEARSQYPLPSVFWQIHLSRWLPWPLIGWHTLRNRWMGFDEVWKEANPQHPRTSCV